jgi:hypothetical protein
VAISSPTVIQGKENPLVSALKYANESMQASIKLMQNAKQLKLMEREQDLNKNLKLLESIDKKYAERAFGADGVGPLAAFDEFGEMYKNLYSSLGMSDAAIAQWAKATLEAPFSQIDIQTAIVNKFLSGEKGTLADLGPSDLETELKTITNYQEIVGTKKISGQGKAATAETPAAPVERPQYNTVLNQVYSDYKAIFERDAKGGRLDPAKVGTTHEWYQSITDPARQAEFKASFSKTVLGAYQRKEITLDEANKALYQIRTNNPEIPLAERARYELVGGDIPKSAGWNIGEGLPAEVPISTRRQTATEAMLARRTPTAGLGVAGASSALQQPSRQPPAQATVKITPEEAAAMVSHGGAAVMAQPIEVVGTGPTADIAKDPKKLAAWQGGRKTYWLSKGTINGVVVDEGLASSLALQESLIPTKTVKKTEQIKVLKTNVPIDPRTEPPKDFVPSGAKQGVVLPFVEPDAVPNKAAWKLGKNLYEHFAKSAAGVEIGKGDAARTSGALNEYFSSLPKGTSRFQEIAKDSYFKMLGNGDAQKGQSLFVAGINTAAYNAQTARAQEERMGEKVFKITVEVPGLEGIKGKALNTEQFQALSNYLQTQMLTGTAQEWLKTQQGALLMKSYEAGLLMLKDVMSTAMKNNPDDLVKVTKEWNIAMANPIYKQQRELVLGVLTNFWQYFDANGQWLGSLDVRSNTTPATGWFLNLLGLGQKIPGMGEVVGENFGFPGPKTGAPPGSNPTVNKETPLSAEAQGYFQ